MRHARGEDLVPTAISSNIEEVEEDEAEESALKEKEDVE